jgi:hypothetical protein
MPKWSELKRFCEHDGWELYKQTDQRIPDGTLKLTKISNSTGDIPKPVWEKIRTKQLQVTQEYFNKLK